MSVAAEIQKPTVSNIFLMEATAGLSLRGWVAHSGTCWKITISDHLDSAINHPTELRADNSVYSEETSIGDVEATPGSWAYISGVVYIRPSGGSIHTKAVIATVPFFFGTKQRITSAGKFYEPRITSIPALSLRIEPRFSGVGQIGSGSCKLANEDGFFDDLARKLDWDYGRVSYYMGVDSNAGEMDFADFEKIGTWRVERAELSDKSFVLMLKELKTNLDRELPFETFNQTDYPFLDRSDIGTPIPRAYGKVFGAKPILINPGARTFKLAGHAIYDILEVRVKNDADVWETANTVTRDLANAEFTLSADGWENGAEVSVDFIGMKLADGRPMYNPAEIVQDILEYIGETDFSGFADAFNEFDLGVQDDGLRKTILKPSLYIAESKKAIELIGSINEVAGSFLYINADGEWHYGVSNPVPLESAVARFTEQDIREDTFTDEVDASALFSKVVCRYARREQDDYSQLVERSRRVNRYGHFPAAEIIKDLDAPLWDEDDAELYSERLLTTEGLPLVRYRFETFWQGFLIVPGSQVHLAYGPKGIDTLVEVIETRHDLVNGRVFLVAIDRRGWGDSFGFWVADSVAAWDAGATPAEKVEAKQASGFWMGDDNLAVSTDGRSVDVSRWY